MAVIIEDSELLRRFAVEKSEAAFAEVVRRNVDFVFSCAVRRVGGDAHLAKDVTQVVFTTLAREAGKVAQCESLSGWLYTAARNAAIQQVRGERRRAAREQEAHLMSELTTTPTNDAEWARLRPVLDEAMDELREEDRAAVLARFFEGKSFGEIGARLRLSENAARMRVERALDTLQGRLAQRGVTSTAAALGVVLAGHVGVAAPAGLAASVTVGALAGVGVEVGAGMAGGLGLFMGTSKLTVGVIGAAAALGVGLALVGTSRARAARAELAAAKSEEAGLATRVKGMESRVQVEAKRVQVAETENARLLAAADRMKVVPVAASVEGERATSGMVIERWRRAQALAKDGDPAEALKELLWCYDVGMVQVASMSAVRASSGVSALAKLGERYPAALAALRERRDKARERLLADESDRASASEFGSINRALKDEAANIALFDQLPAGDRRRTALASNSYEYLVQQQRYKDAIEGRSYASISSVFESMLGVRPAAGLPNPEQIEKRQRESLIVSTTRSIEALAGAGDVANARTLAQRLLAFDNTEATRALIQKHAERAGQPGLLAAPTNR